VSDDKWVTAGIESVAYFDFAFNNSELKRVHNITADGWTVSQIGYGDVKKVAIEKGDALIIGSGTTGRAALSNAFAMFDCWPKGVC